MKRFIFDLITSPLSLFDNPIYDFITMTIIGFIAFKIAFAIVGEMGLRGEAGSIAHWIIRFFILLLICSIFYTIIKIVTFIIDNWIIIIIGTTLLLLILLLNYYAKKNSKSILNKKIF